MDQNFSFGPVGPPGAIVAMICSELSLQRYQPRSLWVRGAQEPLGA